jgi:hypothetical protein
MIGGFLLAGVSVLLRDVLFAGSVAGAVATGLWAVACAAYAWRGLPAGTPSRERGTGALVLWLVGGGWAAWTWWLRHPEPEALPRILLPLGLATVTSWLLLEWGTQGLRRSPRGLPRATGFFEVPVLCWAVDMLVWLAQSSPWLAVAAAGACLVGRWIPWRRAAWEGITRRPWGVVALLVVACGLRLAFAWRLEQAHLDPAVLDGPDSGFYHAAARALAAGDIRLLEPSWLLYPRHNPGPVLLFAGLYALAGPHVVVVRVVQLALAVWSCLLLYGIAKRLFDERAARLGLALIAGHGYLIAYGSYVGSETIGLWLVALCIWWWLRLIQEPTAPRHRRTAWAFGSGVAASWLVLVRPEYAPLPSVAAVWASRRPRQGRAVWAGILALSLVMPALWVVRNGVVHGLWAIQAGKTLGFSTWPSLEQLGVLVRRETAAPPGAPSAAPVSLPSTLDWAQVRQRPVAVLAAAANDMARKAQYLWSWKPYSFPPALVYPVRDSRFFWLVSSVLLIGLLAGTAAWRGAGAGIVLLGLLFAIKTAAHAVSIVAEWHRFTMEPFLNLVEAAGWVWLAQRLPRGASSLAGGPDAQAPRAPLVGAPAAEGSRGL